MFRTRIAILFTLLALGLSPAFAQQAKPDLDELWRVGSLWQVGDNRERVDDARQGIIDSGQDGLRFALTKLDVADTLQIRCLRAVFKGFGDSAYDELLGNVNHDESAARRNVAELLARLNDQRASEILLAQAKIEESVGVKLAQLSALSKWKIADAVPLIVELSADKKDRIRHRATGLLGPYSQTEAVNRLIEMLDDEIYYVREGAQNALVKGAVEARNICLERLRAELELPGAEQNLRQLRLLLPVVSTLAADATPDVLTSALKHESGAVRADAGDALVTWKLGAGRLDDLTDVEQLLRDALKDEYDPFAKTELQEAVARLTDAEEN